MPDETGLPALDIAIGREGVERYEAALQRLRPADREAIIGRLEMQHDYRELAPELGKHAKQTKAGAPPDEDTLRVLRRIAYDVKNDTIRAPLLDVLNEGRTGFDDFRAALETKFDEVMDRTSGWYKRRTQRWLIGIAGLITLAGNVDTVHVATSLWDSNLDAGGEAGLPLGWGDSGRPDSVLGWIGKPLGYALTVFALTLGGPFWFDVLGKYAHLRSTGNREGTAKDDARSAEDRDDPSGRRRARNTGGAGS